MRRVRFHIIYTLRYIKYGFALALLPMLRLLFRLDFENFLLALQQDAVILVSMAALSLGLWWRTSCRWTGDVLEIGYGFGLARRHRFAASQIAVLENYRPLYCRVLGASVVTVYFSARAHPKKKRIYLSKKDAQALCDTLMPLPQADAGASYTVSGWRRLAFILLSANLFTTIFLAFFAVRQLSSFLGVESAVLQEFIRTSVMGIEQVFEIILPAGAALLITLLLLLSLLTLGYSFFHTFRYRLQRHGPLLVESCGLVQHTQRRIRTVHINACDVRYTPLSRIFRRHPVYISAGGYQGRDIPLMLCRSENDARLKRFLPGYRAPGSLSLSHRGPKSFAAFVWQPAALLVLFALLYLSASSVLPRLLPILAIPLFLFGAGILVQIEAYFYEGARAAPGGGMFAQFSRYFTRHYFLIFTPDAALKVSQTPIGTLQGRATLRVYLPSRQRLRVRGVGLYTARHMRFTF